MFVHGDDVGERPGADGAADLLATVGVHAFVAAQVRKLGVGFAADVAAERFDAAVDVLVLLQAARRREVLPTLRARVHSVLDRPRRCCRQFSLCVGQSGSRRTEERP